MIYRQLGKTGLRVSILGQGGAAFGQQYGPVTRETVTECVDAAIGAGINFFDTSAYYGKGLSETHLGQALAGGKRDEVILCTKAGRLDAAEFDFTPAGMRRCVEGSLQRLGTDHVDILLAHDIEFASDYERVFSETAQVLHQLKQEGKARFIGMSGYPIELLKRAILQCDLDVVMSYAHCNLFNNRLLTDLLPIAEQFEVGIVNASPLALGLLTPQGPQPWFRGRPEIRAHCAQAAEICRQRGADISFLGMQYCLAQERIPCTLTGTAKRSELDMNLQAMNEPIESELFEVVMAALDPIRDQSWPSGNWKDEP